MRIQLEKVIKKKFGPVFNSHQLKYQRQEIVADVLERYDEEIRNGAASNDAYQIALSSIGSFKDLRRTLGAVKRRNAILFSILGFVTTAILIVCTVVFQVAAVLLLPLLFGLDGIWYSLIVAELAAAAVTAFFWVKKREVYS